MQRLLPPPLLIITWLAMISAHFMRTDTGTFPVPMRWIGGLIALIGILIAIKGARMFKQVGTNIKTFDAPQELVATGLFAWSRNPMYLGFALCAFCGAIAIGSIPPLIIAALFCVILDRWYVQFEEAIMQKTFGADYTAYCARVRRWL